MPARAGASWRAQLPPGRSWPARRYSPAGVVLKNGSAERASGRRTGSPLSPIWMMKGTRHRNALPEEDQVVVGGGRVSGQGHRYEPGQAQQRHDPGRYVRGLERGRSEELGLNFAQVDGASTPLATKRTELSCAITWSGAVAGAQAPGW